MRCAFESSARTACEDRTFVVPVTSFLLSFANLVRRSSRCFNCRKAVVGAGITLQNTYDSFAIFKAVQSLNVLRDLRQLGQHQVLAPHWKEPSRVQTVQ